MARSRPPRSSRALGAIRHALFGRHALARSPRPRPLRRGPEIGVEPLEPRALLAVTANLVGDALQIVLGAADDVAYLSTDGTNYVVRGTGLSGYAAANASVNSISVAATQAASQSFTVAAGVGTVVTDPLTVAASVERTAIVGAINTTGQVRIDSGAITLAADVTTTAGQTYGGAVGLVGSRTLSAGSGAVSFSSTVDSSPEVFVDPDAFAAGSALTKAFPGITLSATGKNDTSVVVTSKPSGVSTPTSGNYAPTGNRVFAGKFTAWNAAGNVFKAAFASPVSSVSLDFAASWAGSRNAYLQAYNAAGSMMASATYPLAIWQEGTFGLGPQSFITLNVSAPNIAYVLASVDPTGTDTGLLDNLRTTLVTTPAASLKVNSTGATTFGNAVGGKAALASLATDAGGTVSLRSVTTAGAQTFGEAATLNGTYQTTNAAFSVTGAATLTGGTKVATGSGAITFSGAVDGAFSLTANSTGATTFGSAVGGGTKLASLTTDAGGTVSLQSVTTSGAQSYGEVATLKGTYQTTNSAFSVAGAAALAGDTTVSTGSGAITFAGTVDGAFSLAANSTGATTFGGAVGGKTALASLMTNTGGTTAINAGTVKTTGAAGQAYNDAVTLGKDATIDAGAGAVTFASSVTGVGSTTWAKKAGGQGPDYSRATSRLADGSAIVTGLFFESASFGSTTLTSSFSFDIFVAKLDAAGNYVWARKAGGTDIDEASGVSVFPDGSAIVTGRFGGTASFGSTTLTSSGDKDIFVAKLDAAGNFVWARKAGGTDFDYGADISALPDGSAIVTGNFSGTASFGSTSLTSSGSRDIFVAKLDAAGNFVWAKRAGGTGDDYASAVSVSADGSAMITGSFSGTGVFGSTSLTDSGIEDIFFVAKLDAAGNFVWAKKSGGTGNAYGTAVAVLPDGSAIVTGDFYGTASFGSTSLASSGARDIFVAKIDAAGSFVWAKRAGGADYDSAENVSVLPDGSAIVTGVFADTASFGSTTLTSSGDDDIFVAKLDTAGNFVWVRKAGGTLEDSASDVSVLPDGSLIVTGGFTGTASFGSTSLTSSNSDYRNIFVAKLDAAGNWTSHPRLTVNSTGTTRFGGAVSDIGSLVTNAGGTTQLAGGRITTTGSGGQVFNDDVDLRADTTLTAGGNADGGVDFKRTVNGAQTLSIAADGDVFFRGRVGDPAPLTGLSLTAARSVAGSDQIRLDGTWPVRDPASGSIIPTGASVPFTDGLTIAGDVNKVSFTAAGSVIRGFAGDGLRLLGTSKNSTLAGFTISGNGSDGIQVDPGDYTGTRIRSNTIGLAGLTGAAFTTTAGSTRITLAGDQRRFLAIGQSVALQGPYLFFNSAVVRTVVAVTLTGGNTLVTLSAAIDTATTSGFLSTGNGSDGIHLNAARYESITNLTIGGDKTAATSEANQILANASDGIQVDAGTYTGTVIQGNRISTNRDRGIYLDAEGWMLKGLVVGAGVGGAAKFGNEISANGSNGIFAGSLGGIMSNYAGTVIGDHNQITRNGLNGIELDFGGTPGLVITGNTIGATANTGNPIGIKVNRGDYKDQDASAEIRNNSIGFNNGDGIHLATAGDTIQNLLVTGNKIHSNSSDGIQADAGGYGGTTIRGNTISRNTQNGILLNANGKALGGLLIGGQSTTSPGPLDPLMYGTPIAAPALSAHGNTITENGASTGQNGILATVGDYFGTTIAANVIRDNGNKTTRVGSGVRVAGSNLIIGGVAQAGWPNSVGNTISGNALNGVELSGSAAQNNAILSNAISLNGYVETTAGGVKRVVGDGIARDSVANAGVMAPQLTGVSGYGSRLGVFDDALDGIVRVAFVMPMSGNFTVQFFVNSGADERSISPVDTSGFEGRRFVGATGGFFYTSEIQTLEIPASRLGTGRWLTATATEGIVSPGWPAATSPFSSAALRRPIPAAPSAVVATPGNGEVALSWKAPVANGSAAVTDYIVQYSDDAGENWYTFQDGISTQPAAKVSGLANGVPHIFRVAAVNPDGVGLPSATLGATTPAAPTIATTGSLTALATTYGTASAATSVKVVGARLLGSIVATAPAGFEVSSNNATFGPTATFVAAGGAVNGTLSVRLAATTPVGTYADSVMLESPDAWATAVAIPSSTVSPKTLTISGISIADKPYDGTTTATITGTASYGGLANGESFAVLGTPVAAFENKNVGTGKNVTLTGYAAPTANYTLAPPALKASITALPLTVLADDKTRLVNAANPVFTATITGFIAGETAATALTGAPALTTTATQASPFGSYPITAARGTLAATNGNYTFGPFTAGKLTVNAPPGVPPQPTGTAGNAEVALKWQAPASIGSSVITGYSVQFKTVAAQSWSTFGTVAGLAANVTGLTNGQGYVFRVAAVNAVGMGGYSTPSETLTPATTPDAPRNFWVTQTWDYTGGVIMRFDPPASDGGRPVTSYQIEMSTNDGNSWTLFKSQAALSSTMSMTVYPGRETYRFRVRAINAIGGGAYTQPSQPETPYFGYGF